MVGLPLLMSGERGEAAEAAQAFATAIARRTSLPVDTYDERLTSALSERRLREVGVRTGHARARRPGRRGRAARIVPTADLARVDARRDPPRRSRDLSG